MVTDRGGHEAVAVEGHVVVGVLGHLRLFIGHAAQGAGGAGVLLAATLGLHCQNNGRGKKWLFKTLCKIQSYELIYKHFYGSMRMICTYKQLINAVKQT